MVSFFSIPLASISLASILCAFTIKLSRVSASSHKAYHRNHLEGQFWMTTDFVSFATLWDSQVAASFNNFVTNWSTISPGAGLHDKIKILCGQHIYFLGGKLCVQFGLCCSIVSSSPVPGKISNISSLAWYSRSALFCLSFTMFTVASYVCLKMFCPSFPPLT